MLRLSLLFLSLLMSWTSAPASVINISEAVEIGGLKHWITIKGSSKDNPVMLFLHGGPGNSVMSYANKFTGDLQNHFLIVQWDQRGSGETALLNPGNQTLSVDLMVSDAAELINHLCKRFGQNKIYLMGHSWGGFLGLMLAAKHPHLLKRYFAISPMVNQLESERLSLQWMIRKATQEKNTHALNELALINIPFQGGEQLYYHRSWLAKLAGNKFPTREFVEKWADVWLSLFNEASQVNFFEVAPEMKCPIYFMIGTKDYQTYFELAELYYNSLAAERKKLFWFEGSGHSPHTKDPKKFQEIVIREASDNGDRMPPQKTH